MMHNIGMNPFKERSRFTQLLQGLTMTQCSRSSSSFWAGDLSYFLGSVEPECILLSFEFWVFENGQ